MVYVLLVNVSSPWSPLELHKLQIKSCTHMLGAQRVSIEGVVSDYKANL